LTYKIKLAQFEGPFDLLLFFIARDELDIYDIPIAKITNDFLAYLGTMKQLNIDLASEFVLMAATLMRIKSRMLLPRPDLDEQGEAIDPRKELVDRLLEYRRFKDILEDLQGLETLQQARYERGNILQELQIQTEKILADAELEHLTLFRILKAYEQVMLRFKFQNAKIVHTVVHHNYSMEERHEYLNARLQKEGQLDFVQIFEDCENRLHAIFTFLALLEMVQLLRATIHVGQNYNDFELSLTLENL
jgi:segregation and condensation protein A